MNRYKGRGRAHKAWVLNQSSKSGDQGQWGTLSHRCEIARICPRTSNHSRVIIVDAKLCHTTLSEPKIPDTDPSAITTNGCLSAMLG